MTTPTETVGARTFHRPARDRPGLLGPGRPLHLPRHRRGVRRRLLRDGGARAGRRRPPSCISTREDETFYLLEGQLEFRLGEQTITAGPATSST